MFGVRVALLRQHVCGRSQRQLWGTKKIIFGVKSADDKKSPVKSPKRWDPTVVDKNVYSHILDKRMKIKMTTHTLRCIDKAGSFDNYILKAKQLNSERGEDLRKKMVATLEAKGIDARSYTTYPTRPNADGTTNADSQQPAQQGTAGNK